MIWKDTRKSPHSLTHIITISDALEIKFNKGNKKRWKILFPLIMPSQNYISFFYYYLQDTDKYTYFQARQHKC